MIAKRLLTALVGTALVFTLAGCHKEEDARLAAEEEARRQAAAATAAQKEAEAKKAAAEGNTTAAASAAGAAASAGTGSSTVNPLSSSGQSQLKESVAIQPQALENLKIGEVAKFGPFEFTLTQIYLMREATGFPEGYGFLLAEIQLKNTSPDLVLLKPDYFIMYNPKAKQYKPNSQAMAQREPNLTTNVKAGATHKGWTGYLLKVEPGEYIIQIALPGLGYANYKIQL